MSRDARPTRLSFFHLHASGRRRPDDRVTRSARVGTRTDARRRVCPGDEERSGRERERERVGHPERP